MIGRQLDIPTCRFRIFHWVRQRYNPVTVAPLSPVLMLHDLDQWPAKTFERLKMNFQCGYMSP